MSKLLTDRSEALDIPSHGGEGDTAEEGHANGQGWVANKCSI